MRKICVITGTRAEYGLLYWIIKEIENTAGLELQLVVTGMHLSPEFGLTYQEIEKDYTITKKIEMVLSSDTSIGISKSMGLAMISFSEVYEELKPDIIVVLGDRYEIFAAVSAAMISRIPVAHIAGGEATEGLIDEAIRHCLTKMSHFHFTETETYRRRVIQLGEQPDHVFCVGGAISEAKKRFRLLTKDELETQLNFKFWEKTILVTFHPVTLSYDTEEEFKNLLDVLNIYKEFGIIFTKANSDTDGRIINQLIDDYVATHSDRAVAFTSVGHLRYLSMLQYVEAVVGNSSSGLTEAPSFKITTINIGDRQKGRIMADSVISCEPTKESIMTAFEKINNDDFQLQLKGVSNPYESSVWQSKEIVKILKSVNLSNVIKKKFFDMEVSL